MNYRILIICSTLVVLPWLSPLPSQDDTTLVKLEKLGGRRAPKALLNKVTIEKEGITLEEALNLIAEQGNLQVSYNRSVLPLSKSVSLNMRKVSALDALLSILEQTSTELVITSLGQLAIVPKKPAEQPLQKSQNK